MTASEIVFALAIAPLWGGVLWLLFQHRRCRADVDLHSTVTNELDQLQSRAQILLVEIGKRIEVIEESVQRLWERDRATGRALLDVGKRIEEAGSRIPSGVVTDEYLRRVFDVILERLQQALECDPVRPGGLGRGEG